MYTTESSTHTLIDNNIHSAPALRCIRTRYRQSAAIAEYLHLIYAAYTYIEAKVEPRGPANRQSDTRSVAVSDADAWSCRVA